MIFFVKHKHTAETCWSQSEDKRSEFNKAIDLSEESNVKVLHQFTNAPKHTFYFIIEASSNEDIHNFFVPVLTWGEYEIEPVTVN